MASVYPCLWFASNNAEEAVAFYTTVFPNSQIIAKAHVGEAVARVSGQPVGSVLTINFEIEGQRLLALNGGSPYSFSAAISLIVNCDSQARIDELWDAMADGGNVLGCGWVTDRFGVTWQIVPRRLAEMAEDPDPAKSERMMAALIPMQKLDLAALEAAFAGESGTGG